MTNNELLLAISDIVEAKVDPLHKEIQQVRKEVTEKITLLENRITEVETKLESEIVRISVLMENNLVPRIDNIESCYVSTYNRYVEGLNPISSIQSDVDVIKKVVIEHSKKLQRIS